MRRLYATVPVLALFGPLFVVNAVAWPTWAAQVWASVGVLMAGVAITVVWRRQLELAERLDALDGAGETEATAERAAV